MHLGNGPSESVQLARAAFSRARSSHPDMFNWYMTTGGWSFQTMQRSFAGQASSGFPKYQLWKLQQAAKEAPTTEQQAEAIVEELARKMPPPMPPVIPPDQRVTHQGPPPPSPQTVTPVDSQPPGVPRSLIDQYRMQQGGTEPFPSPATATQTPPTGEKKKGGIGALLALGIPVALLVLGG